MQTPIISVSDLYKTYGAFTAVDKLSFDVQPGDVYGFLGPNGAGKSTTIRMLLTLIHPDAGSIKIFGMDLGKHRHSILKKVGSIVEKPDFYNYLSAEKNLELLARVSGVSVKKNVIYEMLELVGLKGREKDKVREYSHGMKQRLGLAQTLIHDPDLIILDEPTTGLDPQGIIDIRNLILFLQKEKKKTILLSSHILSEIELIASRMLIINKGKAIVQGEVKSLLNSDELVVSFQFRSAIEALHTLEEQSWKTAVLRVEGQSLVFHLGQADVPLLNRYFCSRDIDVLSIESKRKLEDYFLRLLTEESVPQNNSL